MENNTLFSFLFVFYLLPFCQNKPCYYTHAKYFSIFISMYHVMPKRGEVFENNIIQFSYLITPTTHLQQNKFEISFEMKVCDWLGHILRWHSRYCKYRCPIGHELNIV